MLLPKNQGSCRLWGNVMSWSWKRKTKNDVRNRPPRNTTMKKMMILICLRIRRSVSERQKNGKRFYKLWSPSPKQPGLNFHHHWSGCSIARTVRIFFFFFLDKISKYFFPVSVGGLKTNMRTVNDNTRMLKQESKFIRTLVLRIDKNMEQYADNMKELANYVKVFLCN